MEEATTEEEGKEVETGGEEVLLTGKVLMNRSPNEPRSRMDGGSSLKNKLL